MKIPGVEARLQAIRECEQRAYRSAVEHVRCPHCGVCALVSCVRPSGAWAPHPHARRLFADAVCRRQE